MKIIAIGDSITKGSYYNGDNWEVAVPNYFDLVCDYFNFDERINYSLNGISVSRTSYMYGENAGSLLSEKADKADVILIALGTNDYGTNVKIGDKKDTHDISFYGGTDVLFKTIKEKNPISKIVVITPINRMEQTTYKNKYGFYLDDYRKVLEEKANEYNFYLIKGNEFNINPDDEECRKKYISDGLHPNIKCHKLYSEYIIQKLSDILK